MEKKLVSVRIPDEMLDDVEKISEYLERDRTWVIVRALMKFLEEEGADVLLDAEGYEGIKNGEVHSGEETKQILNNFLNSKRSQQL